MRKWMSVAAVVTVGSAALFYPSTIAVSATPRPEPETLSRRWLAPSRARCQPPFPVRRSRAPGQARDRVRRHRSHPRRLRRRRSTPLARRGASSSTANWRIRERRASATSRQGAGRRRHRVSHRLDDQELHGDVDPQAPRRGQAVARRSRRAIRPRAEEPALPDDRLAADHHPPPADALRGLPGGQPVGRSAALRERGASCRACCARAFRSRMRQASPTNTRTTGSRFSAASCRASRASPTTNTSRENILKPLGMTSTTLHPSRVAPNRIAIGYRWEDERWKEEPRAPARVVRRDGRHADLDPRSEPLRRRRSSMRGRRGTDRRPARSAARRCARCSSPGAPPACASSSTSRRAPRT